MEAEEELRALRNQVVLLRAELNQLRESTSYRLGRLLTSAMKNPSQIPQLPRSFLRLWRENGTVSPTTGEEKVQRQEVVRRLRNLIADVRVESPSHLVFIFTGTTFIQGTRGNRPIRQSQALNRAGVPVIFSYHRSRAKEQLPDDEAPGLVQSPVDITLHVADEIASADYGAVSKIFVISYPLPEVMSVLDIFEKHGWILLYDCRDDWEEFSKVGMARWYDGSVEQALVKRVRATLCVSGPLCEKMHRLDSEADVRLSPNAVESGFPVGNYIRQPGGARKVVGYFGHLSDAWFDWQALIEAANQCVDFRFEIIGHSPPDVLDLPDNIYLLGPKPWDQLHHYAKSWNAAMIPFRIGKLSDGVDPIKIYEYLALGLPVVSFRMPQIENYPYTKTVSSVSAFCEALRQAVVTEPDMRKIAAFLSTNTWEVRAAELIELADEVA